MTIEEKVGQMTQVYFVGQPSRFEEQVRRGEISSFLGSVLSIMAPEERDELQRIAVEQSRLGIPLIFGFDVIHGYRTIFPIPVAMSCAWDPELIEQVAAMSAHEAAVEGVDWTFGPMIDIARDPRWGRIAEGYGEDTYLASIMAAAAVRGFQGSDLSSTASLAACLKHYVAYGAAEGGRDYNTSEVSKRTLRETYMPPFKAGVDAGAATLMSAFNEISGIPATGNLYTLTEVLKGEWAFDGFVVSDWHSIEEMIEHGFAEDSVEAVTKAIIAGVDMDMKDGLYFDELPGLVEQGKVSEELIDEAVRRILRIKFRKGLFTHPYIDPNLAETGPSNEEKLQKAREVAASSMVLLKNNGLLPLPKDLESIALIGPFVKNRSDLLGCWYAAGEAKDVVALLTGVKEKVSPLCDVLYAEGCDIDGTSTDSIPKAVAVAEQADAVILALGESRGMSGEARNRSSLDLPGVQQELVEAIYATGKPIVAVVFAGRPMSIGWLNENIDAILFAWHPGIQGGNAAADCLFGDFEPTGKLTTSFPRGVGQVPIYYNHKNTGRPGSSKYVDMPGTPLFPFGYGLSYTTFEYDNLQLSDTSIAPDESLTVTADVKNTGERASQEIVQLYICDIFGSVTRPVRELRGFKKITLEPQQKKTVSFVINPTEHLSIFNYNMDYVVEPGLFEVWVGPNSSEGLEAEFEIIEF
ncbi:MAG: beta-glucosidase BglX [Planctomycetota bacterium]|nr:MAG: beta-glucosidase BglX [Planctomycetota bacterium]